MGKMSKLFSIFLLICISPTPAIMLDSDPEYYFPIMIFYVCPLYILYFLSFVYLRNKKPYTKNVKISLDADDHKIKSNEASDEQKEDYERKLKEYHGKMLGRRTKRSTIFLFLTFVSIPYLNYLFSNFGEVYDLYDELLFSDDIGGNILAAALLSIIPLIITWLLVATKSKIFNVILSFKQLINSSDNIFDAIVVKFFCLLIPYVLIGCFFGGAWFLIVFQEAGALKDISRENIYDVFYYSFVNLSTLGYGDVSPLKPIAKWFSIIETIFGVAYMAIVVGVSVGYGVSFSMNSDKNKVST